MSKRLDVSSNFFHLRVATSFSLFAYQCYGNIPTRTHLTGASNAGVKESQFSTNISLYLWNDTRYGHSYYGMRIGNCAYQSFRMIPFSWPWTTPNPDFKVTPFNAEYLWNCTWYRHSYNETLIGTYIRPTQRCYFEWSWVTLSDLAKYSMTQSIARSLGDSWAYLLVTDQKANRQQNCSVYKLIYEM